MVQRRLDANRLMTYQEFPLRTWWLQKFPHNLRHKSARQELCTNVHQMVHGIPALPCVPITIVDSLDWSNRIWSICFGLDGTSVCFHICRQHSQNWRFATCIFSLLWTSELSQYACLTDFHMQSYSPIGTHCQIQSNPCIFPWISRRPDGISS